MYVCIMADRRQRMGKGVIKESRDTTCFVIKRGYDRGEH